MLLPKLRCIGGCGGPLHPISEVWSRNVKKRGCKALWGGAGYPGWLPGSWLGWGLEGGALEPGEQEEECVDGDWDGEVPSWLGFLRDV